MTTPKNLQRSVKILLCNTDFTRALLASNSQYHILKQWTDCDSDTPKFSAQSYQTCTMIVNKGVDVDQ